MHTEAFLAISETGLYTFRYSLSLTPRYLGQRREYEISIRPSNRAQFSTSRPCILEFSSDFVVRSLSVRVAAIQKEL